MVKRCILEVPIDNIASARAAILGGADRLELCSALAVGGLTPTVGVVQAIVNLKNGDDCPSNSLCAGSFVMIRPRVGDFCYSSSEIQSMIGDIHEFKKINGVSGFVFGVLNSFGDIDADACRKLLSACSPLPVTFHRAFDYSLAKHKNDLSFACKLVQEIADIGFTRILTSGGQLSALDGCDVIKAINEYVIKNKLSISIMPGSGVSSENARAIIEITKCVEIHSSCKSKPASVPTDSVEQKLLASFGSCTDTNIENVFSLCQALENPV